MTRIPSPASSTVTQRLIAEADRRGNADGVASRKELESLARTMETRAARAYDPGAGDRLETVRKLAGGEQAGFASLDSALQKLPTAVRRLALELDAHWGNADGKISAKELDRVARYYLAALPFFTPEAGHLLELARFLKLDDAPPAKTASGVVALRVALAKVDRTPTDETRSFRALFDEAVQAGDAIGAPELLREAAKHSPKWHRLSVLEHSAAAVRAVVELSNAVGADWKEGAGAMLLHDVGKILDRQVQVEGDSTRYSFWDHEAEGAKWLKDKGVSQEVLFQIHHHAHLRGSSVEEMEALAGGDKDRLARMVVVYVADQTAKVDTPDQLASLQSETPKILELCKRSGIDGEALMKRAAEVRAELSAGIV